MNPAIQHEYKIRKVLRNITTTILLTSLFCIPNYSIARKADLLSIPRNIDRLLDLHYPRLVEKFYTSSDNRLFWFSVNNNSLFLRRLLKERIDSSAYLGLKKENYHIEDIIKYAEYNFTYSDSMEATKIDYIFTDAAIAYCKDVYQGNDIVHWMMFDEISAKNEEQDNQFLIQGLSDAKAPGEFNFFFNSLEPTNPEYISIKKELQSKADSLTLLQKKQLISSLQIYRWMHHFKFEKWIVVNIASATLRYYEYDSIKLIMKVVLGKPSTKTPRIAAHCNEVILYPYWNVPPGIALNELLPEFKKNPEDVDALNMQILDLKGNVIDHHRLNWKNYSRNYFPFRIRQSTGCDNSLGIMKFNLTSPFSVYLHDTNNKVAFLSGLRYYSHGCIRIEEPIELANYLLPGKIDSKFLEACLKNQLPVNINIVKPVPVFVIYQTVETNISGKLKYYKDVYGLLR